MMQNLLWNETHTAKYLTHYSRCLYFGYVVDFLQVM